VTVTAQGDFKPFKSTDVGRSIRFEYPGREPGWGVITAYTNSQNVSVLLYRDTPSAAPLESWRMGAWSDTTGWPHVGTFYQQRLFTARNLNQPQTIWASQSGDFQNMRPDSWVAGAADRSGYQRAQLHAGLRHCGSDHMADGRKALDRGNGNRAMVYLIEGRGADAKRFLGRSAISVKARDVPPVQIDSGGLFIQRAKRALYDLGYSFQIDALKASDVTILSDHIGKGNFAQIVYQAEPISSVWGRLEDGTMTCMTYKRDQNVVGWTPCAGGKFAGAAVVESISVIPGNNDSGQVYNSINRDEVWMIVNRTINGSTKRYIEMMEGYFDGPNRATYLDKSEWRAAMKAAQVDAFYVDCGLTYSGVPPRRSPLPGSTIWKARRSRWWPTAPCRPTRRFRAGDYAGPRCFNRSRRAVLWLDLSRHETALRLADRAGRRANQDDQRAGVRAAGFGIVRLRIDLAGDGDEESGRWSFLPCRSAAGRCDVGGLSAVQRRGDGRSAFRGGL
jgi:hypothetical protein